MSLTGTYQYMFYSQCPSILQPFISDLFDQKAIFIGLKVQILCTTRLVLIIDLLDYLLYW